MVFMQKFTFYKTSSFYISIFALFLSIASFVISYLSSPLSSYTKPKIFFGSAAAVIKKIDENKSEVSMEGIIYNESDYGAEDVIVKISTPIDENTKFISYKGLPYKLLTHDKVSIVIQYPKLPPRYSQGITVSATTENRWIKPGAKWHYSPAIDSVSLQNGIAQNLNLNFYKQNQ